MKLISAPLVACLMVGSVVVAKQYFPGWASVAFLEGSVFFLSGLIAGVRLPDLDLILPGFSHRSGISHSCLPAALLWLGGWYPIAAGLALGIALHLSSDLQPRAWTGGALIKFPIIGSIGLLSPLWLIVNILGCLVILMDVMSADMAKVSMNTRHITMVIGAAGGLWYFCQEEKRPLLPLITLGFGMLLVHAIRGGALTVKLVFQYVA